MLKLTRSITLAAPIALALPLLAACGADEVTPPVVVAPAPTPTPAPPPTETVFNVTPCLQQMVPGTGITVAEAVVPDTLTLNLAAPAGFPNGRLPTDPVIDVTLAVIFLDLSRHAATTFAGIPLNPPANDVPFRTQFPYLAMPQGNPPLADMAGSNFNFRTDAPSEYTRVDRMGMPAVSTVLIGSDLKNGYNDANPADDANGDFVPELAAQLTGLTGALADDLAAANLTPCAVAQ